MAEAAIDREVLAQIRRIQVRTDRMAAGAFAGGYCSVFRGAGIEFEQVREFAEGDDPRSVDWNVTARTGRPHVKQFTEERELCVQMLLDVSASMTFGGGRTVRAAAALFCGCIAFAAARNHDRAGLIAFSDRIERYVPAKKGRRHVLRLIREAYALLPQSHRTDIGAALEHTLRVQKKRAVVFVVSDFLAPVADRPLQALARRHDVIAVRLQDDRTLELPKAGLLRLRDLEHGRECVVDSDSARVREAYRDQVRQRRAAFAAQCRRARVDLLEIPTGGNIVDPIVGFFRMRERRGRHR